MNKQEKIDQYLNHLGIDFSKILEIFDDFEINIVKKL